MWRQDVPLACSVGRLSRVWKLTSTSFFGHLDLASGAFDTLGIPDIRTAETVWPIGTEPQGFSVGRQSGVFLVAAGVDRRPEVDGFSEWIVLRRAGGHVDIVSSESAGAIGLKNKNQSIGRKVRTLVGEIRVHEMPRFSMRPQRSLIDRRCVIQRSLRPTPLGRSDPMISVRPSGETHEPRTP